VAGRAPFARIAADHLLSLMDAELAWIDRSITSLRAVDTGPYAGHPADPSP
jgi:hypothetical protein